VKGWGGVIGEGRENCFEQLSLPSPKETPSNWQFIANKKKPSAKR